MTAKHKLTPDKIKAHLTQKELERIEHIRPQMTYTTTQLIESLVEERIQKAALLAACKFFMKALDDQVLVRNTDCDGEGEWALRMVSFVNELKKAQSTISQAEQEVK